MKGRGLDRTGSLAPAECQSHGRGGFILVSPARRCARQSGRLTGSDIFRDWLGCVVQVLKGAAVVEVTTAVVSRRRLWLQMRVFFGF